MIIAKLERARCTLVLRDGDRWVIEQQGRSADLSDTIVPFVSCLEEPLAELRGRIVRGLAENGLPSNLEGSFPYERIAIEGLRSRSPKWVRLAAAWLGDLELNPALAEALREMIACKVGTQRDRQAAMIRLKRK